MKNSISTKNAEFRNILEILNLGTKFLTKINRQALVKRIDSITISFCKNFLPRVPLMIISKRVIIKIITGRVPIKDRVI